MDDPRIRLAHNSFALLSAAERLQEGAGDRACAAFLPAALERIEQSLYALSRSCHAAAHALIRPVTSTRASRTDTRERRPRGQKPLTGPDRHTRGRPNCWPRSTTPPQPSEPQLRVAHRRAISWPRRWRHPRACPGWNTEPRRRRPHDDRRARDDRLVRPHARDSRTGQRALRPRLRSSRRRRPSAGWPTPPRLRERSPPFSAASKRPCVSCSGRPQHWSKRPHGSSSGTRARRIQGRDGGPSACGSAMRTFRPLSPTPSARRPRLAR